MGFLAKLIAPHVVGPEQPTTDAAATSSSSPSQTQAPPPPPTPKTHTASDSAPTEPPKVIDTSSTAHLTPLQRQLKQLSLLALGAGFMAATVAVTRRAVIRRQREAIPRFFHSSVLQPGSVDQGERSALAAQALGLATLNVAGFGVLLTGGLSYAFDLCSVAELQARTQAAIRQPSSGVISEEDEKEVDRMVVGLMQRLGMDVDAAKEQERLDIEKAKAEQKKA